MPIRRNLSVSLPPQSPLSIRKAQAFEEGLFPLQCTPEPSHKPVQDIPPPGASGNVDPNVTFDVLDDDQTACNDTIVIGAGSPGPSQVPRTDRAQEGNQVPFKR